MSYLSLSGFPGDNFEQAVISVWFRVPQASLDAATTMADQRYNSETFVEVDFTGIIPLFTWGDNPNVNFWRPSASGTEISVELFGSSKRSPSIIGIRCGYLLPGSSNDTPFVDGQVLYAKLQYDTGGLGPLVYLGTGNKFSGSPVDGPDFFQMGGSIDGSVVGYSSTVIDDPWIHVIGEEWHHVLVSFDMSGGCSVTTDGSGAMRSVASACPFWWAYDDQDYTGAYLYPSGGACFTEGPGPDNGIVSMYSGGYATSFGAGGLPAGGNPMGTPTSDDNFQYVYHIELAELQLFTGVTLDTSEISQRRYFIDDNGKPVDPNKQATGKDPSSGSIEGLGQQPAVLLHRSNNWIRGKNTGTSGLNSDGTVNPDGQFFSVGAIAKYQPDPSLHGPQSPTQQAAARRARAGPVQLSRKPRPRLVRPRSRLAAPGSPGFKIAGRSQLILPR